MKLLLIILVADRTVNLQDIFLFSLSLTCEVFVPLLISQNKQKIRDKADNSVANLTFYPKCSSQSTTELNIKLKHIKCEKR